MEKIAWTMIIAGIGGLIGIKLKIPAGALIGSMIFVAIYQIGWERGVIPVNFKLIAQMIVGGMIGLNFTRSSLAGLKELWIPALILISGLTLSWLILGFLIAKLTGLELVTALFSSAPGGLADMTLMAEAYGAEISNVALLHLIRMLVVVTVLPFIIGWLTNLSVVNS